MTSFAIALLTVLLGLPAAYQDRHEDPGARWERLARIAQAVDAAATETEGVDRAQLAAVVLALGWWETRYARRVHAGRCAAGECGARYVDGRLTHASRTPWQIEQSTILRRGEWSAMVGDDLDATTVAARVATRIVLVGYRRCGNWTGAISVYAGVSNGRWSQAPKRWQTAQRIRQRIAAVLPPDVEVARD